MNPDTYKHYLRDLIYLIKERESELKSDKNKSDFDSGIEYTYSEIIDLIKNQADAFQIDISDFGFNDFEKYTNQRK